MFPETDAAIPILTAAHNQHKSAYTHSTNIFCAYSMNLNILMKYIYCI